MTEKEEKTVIVDKLHPIERKVLAGLTTNTINDVEELDEVVDDLNRREIERGLKWLSRRKNMIELFEVLKK